MFLNLFQIHSICLSLYYFLEDGGRSITFQLRDQNLWAFHVKKSLLLWLLYLKTRKHLSQILFFLFRYSILLDALLLTISWVKWDIFVWIVLYYFTEYPISFQSYKAGKKILLFFFPDALTDLVGDEYLVTGENATAGIWATYPTQGISTVNCKVFIFNFTNFACTYRIFFTFASFNSSMC